MKEGALVMGAYRWRRAASPLCVWCLLLASAVLAAGMMAMAWAQEGPAEGAVAEQRPPVEVRGQVELRSELRALAGVQSWRVNGEEITLAEVQDRAVAFHGPYLLQDLVCAALLRQEAERRGITVREEEVETEMTALREEMGLRSADALAFHLRQRRLTEDGFRQQAREYLLLAKTLADRVYVPDREVAQFYSRYENTLYFRRPQVQFRIMSLATEAGARAAKQELGSGRNFVEVAKEVAERQGGDRAVIAVAGGLNSYEKGQQPRFPPDFEEALFAAPLNQVVGPIKSFNRFHLVKVEKKTDAYQIPLEEVREDIRLLLRRQRLEQVVWPKWIGEQLANAEVEVIRAEGEGAEGQDAEVGEGPLAGGSEEEAASDAHD